MKEKFMILLIFTATLFADSFDVNLSINTETKNNYGHWELNYSTPDKIDPLYKGNIIKTNDLSSIRYYIELSDINIFNQQMYLKKFLKHGYYELTWVPSKGSIGDEMWKVSTETQQFLKESQFYKSYHAQDGWEEIDWSMLLADYINYHIHSIPTYQLHIKNTRNNPIEILSLYAKSIFTTGGEASTGGAYLPTQEKINYFPLHWNKRKVLTFEKSILLNNNQETNIPLSIVVKKGAQGDGPGILTVALFMKYKENGKEKNTFLLTLSQSEDYGYETGW